MGGGLLLLGLLGWVVEDGIRPCRLVWGGVRDRIAPHRLLVVGGVGAEGWLLLVAWWRGSRGGLGSAKLTGSGWERSAS